MDNFIFALFCVLGLSQNAFAQLGLGTSKGLGSLSNLGSNLANTISGNSVVSNNIGIGNFGGADAKSLAAQIGNSLASNIGNNVASNVGGTGNFVSNIVKNSVGSDNLGLNLVSNVANANSFGSNLATSSSANVIGIGSNLASNGAGISFSNSGANNVVISGANNLASNIGTSVSANKVGNFVGGNVGGSSISLGNVQTSGISNFKLGEIELVNNAAVNTGYTGELPIIGYVTFEGYIPAEGVVSVANDCGCTS